MDLITNQSTTDFEYITTEITKAVECAASIYGQPAFFLA